MTESNETHDVEADSAEDRETIRGKVVDFVNNREIIMNVGKKDGVKIGMQFAILVLGATVEFGEGDEKFTETVEVPKSIVKVVRLSGERLSIGRTFMTIKGHPAYEVENPYYLFRHTAITGYPFDPTERTKKYPAVPDRVETFDIAR